MNAIRRTRRGPFDGDSAIFNYCSEAVGASFDIQTWDHGDGHVSWYAVRGKPTVLFNVHLDTVPVGDGWSSDPHQLRVEEGRAYGRGACDIKGAAAALLTLAEQGAGHLALLFTSDEEGAGGCCVSRFLESGAAARFEQVVVAEPTSCRAVLGHRGFLSVKTRFLGTPGHSSEARALQENANHQMARWAARALQLAASRKSSPEDPGTCLNIGLVEGGTKSNVIAGGAFVHWSARLRPGESNEEFLQEIQACADADARVNWEVPFRGEPLPAAGRDDSKAQSMVRIAADCPRATRSISGPRHPCFPLPECRPWFWARVTSRRPIRRTNGWRWTQLQQALDLYGQLVERDD